jgi:glycosyltransferase involved in cell wall biosynthesis
MNSTLVHLVSDVIQYELSRLGIGFRNYDVLEVPVGLDHELMRQCLSTDQSKVYDLAYMGLLSAEKGIYDLLYVVGKVTRDYRPIKLLLLGDFSSPYEKGRFMDLTRRLGIEEMVVYAGYKVGTEKYCELSKASVFLFPSYVDVLSISILEALGMGLPVITWDLPYASQFKTSAVIRVQSRKDFVDKVIALLRDQAYIEELSNEARRFAMRYTWDAAAYSEYKAYIKSLSWWYR